MSQSGGQSEGNRIQPVFTLTIAIVALQVGCLILFIILGALIAGLWLDRTLGTLPIFLIIFLVGSMPLSWVAIFFIVNRAKKRLNPNTTSQGYRSVMMEESNGDSE
jgi:F0F1-type ATP synthase assembly protein I